MSTHGPHQRNVDGLPLLCDGCPRCEEQAEDLGINLDQTKWRQAWAEMIRVEFHEGGYYSAADKKLGSSLYVMALLLHRNAGIDPRDLLPKADEQDPMSLRPRPGETPQQTLDRVVNAVRGKP